MKKCQLCMVCKQYTPSNNQQLLLQHGLLLEMHGTALRMRIRMHMEEVVSSTLGLAIQTVIAKKWRTYKVGGLFSNPIHA